MYLGRYLVSTSPLSFSSQRVHALVYSCYRLNVFHLEPLITLTLLFPRLSSWPYLVVYLTLTISPSCPPFVSFLPLPLPLEPQAGLRLGKDIPTLSTCQLFPFLDPSLNKKVVCLSAPCLESLGPLTFFIPFFLLDLFKLGAYQTLGRPPQDIDSTKPIFNLISITLVWIPVFGPRHPQFHHEALSRFGSSPAGRCPGHLDHLGLRQQVLL